MAHAESLIAASTGTVASTGTTASTGTAGTALPLLALLAGLALGFAIAWWIARFQHAAQASATGAQITSLEAQLEAERRTAQSSLMEARREIGSRESVKELMAPVTAGLIALDSRLQSVDRRHSEAKAELSEQVRQMQRSVNISTESLGRETRRLTTALSRSDVRGRWGEMQLKRLVEASGLLERVHFDTQVTVTGDTGTLRPDMLIHLGEGKDIVIDAKVSLQSFLAAEAADSDDEREAALDSHVSELDRHVRSLSSKAYGKQFSTTPEFVVMFVPAEGLLVEALRRDPDLLERALEKNVVIATPAVLMALLRTVSHIWRQEAAASQAREIHAIGLELHSRIGTMATHFVALGKRLGSAVEAYNSTLSSMESRVLVTARRFNAVDLTAEDIAPLAQVDKFPRVPVAPELVPASSDAPRIVLEE